MSYSSLLNQTISLYTRSGYDRYGRETVGGAVTHKARVEEVSKSRLLPNGQAILINLIVFLKSSVSIEINDRVTYSGKDYKVFGVEKPIDRRLHHVEVECIKWQS
jgi:hypothetical protein